jgi:hypothetical protein
VLRAPKSDEPLQLRQLGAHASMRPRTVVLDEDLLFTKKFKPRPVHLAALHHVLMCCNMVQRSSHGRSDSTATHSAADRHRCAASPHRTAQYGRTLACAFR